MGYSMAYIQGSFYTIGGWTEDTVTDRIARFSSVEKKWTTAGYLNQARRYHSSKVFKLFQIFAPIFDLAEV